MSVRYVLHPGRVVSKNDGGVHMITAEKLAQCYQIPITECIVVREDAAFEEQRMASEKMTRYPNLIHLHPREEGDYREYLAGRREQLRNR
jgi:hypothetical protein